MIHALRDRPRARLLPQRAAVFVQRPLIEGRDVEPFEGRRDQAFKGPAVEGALDKPAAIPPRWRAGIDHQSRSRPYVLRLRTFMRARFAAPLKPAQRLDLSARIPWHIIARTGFSVLRRGAKSRDFCARWLPQTYETTRGTPAFPSGHSSAARSQWPASAAASISALQKFEERLIGRLGRFGLHHRAGCTLAAPRCRMRPSAGGRPNGSLAGSG